MKHFFKTILFIVLACYVQGIHAQGEALEAKVTEQDDFKKNEVLINVGSQWFLSDVSCDPEEYNRYSPSFSLGYMYHKSKNWSYGAHLSYMQNKEQRCYYLYDGTAYFSTYERYKSHLISVLGTTKRSWSRHKYWNMYSRLAVGPTIFVDKHIGCDTKVNAGFSVQFTPLAIEGGNDKLRGFFELGFGVQGIVSAGISHRF